MLNPVAIFKLDSDAVVEVVEDGKTYSAEFVAAKEAWTVGPDDAAMDRLNADSGYIVQGGDSEIAIDEADIIDIIRTETL